MFSGLQNEVVIKKLFEPTLDYLKKSSMLVASDEFSVRLLLEKVDDYISHLKERAQYFAEVRPEVIRFDGEILEKKLEALKVQLAIKEEKNEKFACKRLEQAILETEKELFLNSQREKFKTLKLLKTGEVVKRDEISTSDVARDITQMLKENALSNVIRLKLQNSLKLETQQKTIADVLAEMMAENNEQVLN